MTKTLKTATTSQNGGSAPHTLNKKPESFEDGSGSLPLNWLPQLMLTYATLTLLLKQELGSPAVAEDYASQVPRYYHQLASVAFGCAFLLDLLAVLFYWNTAKWEYILYPAYIKGLPFVSSILMSWSSGVVVVSGAGKLVSLTRYICWMHTAPVMLLLVQSAATSLTMRQTVYIILLHEVQLGTAAFGKVYGGWLEGAAGLFAHVSLVPVVFYLHKALKEVTSSHGPVIARIVLLTQLVAWVSFGIPWDLGYFGYLTPAQEEGLYLIAEFLSKMLCSSALMFGNFVAADQRRSMVMRSIELTHKGRLVEELQVIVQQKDTFMSSISHELRTPLNGIIGLSEAVLANEEINLTQHLKQQFVLIRSSGLRLLNLVNDILDATALNHGGLRLKQEKVALKPLLDDVIDLTRPLVKREVQLKHFVASDLYVMGDPERIVQVLNNLISNAIKFTFTGSVHVTARLDRAGPGPGSMVLVSVKDTGLGIEPSKQQTIFLPFEQLHTSISRSYRGLGLGLNIVQRLVAAMGGEVRVTSEPNKGSTFTFTLPSYDPSGSTSASGRATPNSPTRQRELTAKPSITMQGPAAADRRQSPTPPPARLASKTTRSSNNDMDSPSPFSTPRAVCKADWSTHGFDSDSAIVPGGGQYLQLGESQGEAPMGTGRMSGRMCSSKSSIELRVAEHATLAEWWATYRGPKSSNSSARSGSRKGQQQGLIAEEATFKAKQLYSEVHGGVKQVLCVDDDEINQQVLALILSAEGYALVQKMSGPEALLHVETCEYLPDICLLDVSMPGMDGLEVCRRIRSMLKHSTLQFPIIMLTAQTSEDSVLASLEAGADDHLGKPYTRPELLARVALRLNLGQHGPVLPDPNAAVRRTVLYADTDEHQRSVIEGILLSEGYNHVPARSGGEVLDILQRSLLPGATCIDVLLCDFELPDVRGAELCTRVKQMPFPICNIPAIILTNSTSEKVVVEALESGATDCISKPVRRRELLMRIKVAARGQALTPRPRGDENMSQGA